MKVLLISDDPAFANTVRNELVGKDATLYVESEVPSIEAFLARERPQVIINALMDRKEAIDFALVRTPINYSILRDFWLYDLSKVSIDQIAHDGVSNFIRGLSIREDLRRIESPLSVEGGMLTLTQATPLPELVAQKTELARRTLIEAKEILSGLVGFDAKPETVGNRLVVPISTEVIHIIGRSLDAGIALTETPLVAPVAKTPLKRIATFLEDAQRALEQLEKAITAAVKVAGVLSILTAAIAAAVGKLDDLLRALGF